jgi:pimeloyl-ACP methyl ester carboxylesterase
MENRVPYAPVNGIQLYYEEAGSGPPLVLLHRFSGSGQLWKKLVAPLSERYRVIVPDMRGHGRSDGAPVTIRHHQFARDHVALLDHLGIERAHFVGHSSGGMSLLFLGTQNIERVDSLVLVNATYVYDGWAKSEMRRVSDEMTSDPQAIEAAQRLHARWHGDDYWQVLRDVFRGFGSESAHELDFRLDDLRAIDCPVLVLHGDRDPFFPVAVPVAMYSAFPRAELAILPNVGHTLPRDAPDLFVTLVTQFHERLAGSL